MRIYMKNFTAIGNGFVRFLLLLSSLLSLRVLAQGEFLTTNGSAPTRLGSIDGPLAGPDILAQFLAGGTANSLAPVGIPIQHRMNGSVFGQTVVSDLPCGAIAQIQMVAWDSTVWGDSLDSVPAGQLGQTDIVPVNLSCAPVAITGPVFRTPAIVPPVPEPSGWSLVALGGFWMLGLRNNRKTRSPKRKSHM